MDLIVYSFEPVKFWVFLEGPRGFTAIMLGSFDIQHLIINGDWVPFSKGNSL